MAKHMTCVYATHGNLPLECDVYSPSSLSQISNQSKTVLLYFHSGGLVDGARQRIPPWLVQATVFERAWTLISPSYRLLPQVSGKELLDDTMAAYKYAQTWAVGPSADAEDGGQATRLNRVVASGGSAGFFLATLLAHHASTHNISPPAALLSLTGITTHRHPFFHSSVQLMPKPIKDSQMAQHINSPVQIGTMHRTDRAYFSLDKLLASGRRNAEWSARSTQTPPPPALAPPPPALAPPPPPPPDDDSLPRGCLYDYFLFNNQYLSLIGNDVDVGFDYLGDPTNADKLRAWPPTLFILGDADEDVNPAVTTDITTLLSEKAKVFTANGEGHLFNETWYLEDTDQEDSVKKEVAESRRERQSMIPGMEVVKQALCALDKALKV